MTQPAPAPRTAAGRALLHDFTNDYVSEGSSGDSMKKRILAIEAEAAAQPQPSEALREAVLAYVQWHEEEAHLGDPQTPTWKRMKAALAAAQPADGLDVERLARVLRSIIGRHHPFEPQP